MTVENLWQEYPKELQKPEFLDFLHQQIAFFKEMTGERLVGDLVFHEADERLRYDLDIIAPVLDDYSFTLLSVLTGPTEYPLTVEYALENREAIQCHTHEEFKQAIKTVISSARAHEAIISTLRLANEESRVAEEEGREANN